MRYASFFRVLLSCILLLTAAPLPGAQADPAGPATPPTLKQLAAAFGIQVDAELLTQLEADPTTGYLIYFKDHPDLSPAYQMSWDERGTFVMNTLQAAAKKSQAGVRAELDAAKAVYQSFWIDNIIAVDQSNTATVSRLLTHPEIASLRALVEVSLIEPIKSSGDLAAPAASNAIEPNITHVKADQAWALGINGAGSVVGSIDTGVRYTHQALVNHYRGNLGGGVFDHNYNWWDPHGDHPAAPADDNGHGTHTMGTMVGNDGGANQIGVAPGAKWMACRIGVWTNAALLECAQFMAAPWNLSKANPDPAKRPFAVNNSWGDCSQSYNNWFQGAVDSWEAAGIYPVFANGNNTNCGYSTPPGPNTVTVPARYGNVTGVGSTGQSNGQYATHSNRGPSDNPDTINPRGYPTIKPQVVAPGVDIRSSIPTSDSSYEGGWAGTSMSAPHVTGLIALLWQAGTCLKGDYARTETLIEQTATPITTGLPADNPSGEGPGKYPNQSTGWGEINALAAVQAAQTLCGNGGVLAGHVTTPPNTPVASVTVQATTSPTQTASSVTDEHGNYTLWLATGIPYTVSVSTYGYAPYAIGAISVVTTTTTTLDISLTPIPAHVVSGTVTDAATGWPLYATLSITGTPSNPTSPNNQVWTDPLTGFYSVTLAEGITYTFSVAAQSLGYLPIQQAVSPLTGNQTRNYALNADLTTCAAPGYTLAAGTLVEGFDSATPPNLPVGWVTAAITDTTISPAWATATGTQEPSGYAPDTSPNLVYFNSYDVDPGDAARLYRTSGLNLSTFPSSLLSFKVFHDTAYANAADRVQVQVSTNGGTAWQNVGEPVLRYDGSNGWKTHLVDLNAYASQTALRLGFLGIGDYGNDLHLDNIRLGASCAPQAGGLVMGSVFDDNTDLALNGALVSSDSGQSAVTLPTSDPDLPGSVYTLFAPAGSHVLTATMAKYGPVVTTQTVVLNNTIWQDFSLPAGKLALSGSLSATVSMGTSASQLLTLTNSGGRAASFSNLLFLESPWGSITPVTGTVAAGAAQPLTLTFNAGTPEVTMPGTYSDYLLMRDDTPYLGFLRDITMTVTAPATYGVLTGTIKGLAACDVNPTPMPDALVYVESGTGYTRTLFTNADGVYTLWLDQANSPLTVTVSNEAGYEAQMVSGLSITAGQTTTHNVNLRLYTPCATVTPDRLSSTQATNQVMTKTLTIDNAGAAPIDWNVKEGLGLFAPAMPQVGRTGQTSPVTLDGAANDVVGNATEKAGKPQPSAIGLASRPYHPTATLWDNGPLVTHTGGGTDGADVSAVQTSLGMGTFGFAHSPASGYRVADDFIVSGGNWQIDKITFFAYQTGSGTESTINQVNLRIWDGVPGATGSHIVWGDTTTNRLSNTIWSNIYRANDTSLSDANRPIMANTVDVGTLLPPGTYWLDWQTGGTLTSGPWASPITQLGQTATGNARQYVGTVGMWVSTIDVGPQGLPFIIEGSSTGCKTDLPWVSVAPISGTVAADSSRAIDVVFNSAGLTTGLYSGNLCVNTTDPRKPTVFVPVSLAVPDCAVRLNNAATAYPSVQAAVDASTSPSDVVKVAGYCPGVETHSGLTQTVIVTKSLTIQGGYTTTNWTAPYPITQPATLDALNLGRVVLIKDNASVTLGGLNIVNGNGYVGGLPGGSGQQWGGGVFALTSTLQLLNSRVINNKAWWGGGVGAEGSVLTLTHAALLSNTVGGDGGGLSSYRGQAVVNDSQILYNQAALNSGGIANDNGQMVVNRSTIGYNVSSSANSNFGNGGLANMACDASSSLTINDSQVIYNTNPLGNGGGGVSNHAAVGLTANLVINRSTIANNSTSSYSALSGFGGGIKNGAMDAAGSCPGTGSGMPMAFVTVNDSVIKNNSATNGGGIGNGILPTGAPVPMVMAVTLNNTTVSGNTAGVQAGGYITQTGNGGGIFNVNGTVTAVNSTVSGNAATTTSLNPNSQSGLGGGFANAGAGLPTSVVLTNTTVAQNGALLGAGLANAYLLPVPGGYPAAVATYGSIIANNTAAIPTYNGCLNNPGVGAAAITSRGYNLESGNTCALSATGDLTNTNPLLGALANNGGPATGSGLPAYTQALLKGSPAIDAIPNAACAVAVDERGIHRPIGFGCDIGAYEAQYLVYLPLIRR